MKYKYIVLDFGNVIAKATTGYWFVTPKFFELLPNIDIDKYNEAHKEYNYILSEKMNTLEEEYDSFLRYYEGVLSAMGYDKELAKEIAYDRTYKNSKYTLFDNVINELEILNKKYKLLMLTDNWPCVMPYLEDNKLLHYFDKVYISSVYGEEKRNGKFFDYLIDDYKIKPGEALFIDDFEENLDVAVNKGLDVKLMDRFNNNVESKYEVINDLLNI